MTKEQIITVCKDYDVYLEALGHGCEENNNSINETEDYAHIRWMLSEIPNKEMDKANRWLGFVQGFMWVNGHYEISDLRTHNR